MSGPAAQARFDDYLSSPEFYVDPYPVYHILRDEAPIFWSERWNAWVLTRYADVLTVVRDPDSFSNGLRVPVFLDQLPPSQRARFGMLEDHFAAQIPPRRPDLPHTPAHAHHQGLHRAHGTGAAGPHPGAGRRAVGWRRGKGADGRHLGLCLSPAGRGHRRNRRHARTRYRHVQGVVLQHNGFSRCDAAGSRLHRRCAAEHRRAEGLCPPPDRAAPPPPHLRSVESAGRGRRRGGQAQRRGDLRHRCRPDERRS